MSEKPPSAETIKLSPNEMAREAEQGNFKKVNDLLKAYLDTNPNQFKEMITAVKQANLDHVQEDREAVKAKNNKWYHFGEDAKPTLPTLIFTDSNGDKIPDKISGFILQDGTKVAQPEKAAATASEPKQSGKEGRTFSFGPVAAENAWKSFYPDKK